MEAPKKYTCTVEDKVSTAECSNLCKEVPLYDSTSSAQMLVGTAKVDKIGDHMVGELHITDLDQAKRITDMQNITVSVNAHQVKFDSDYLISNYQIKNVTVMKPTLDTSDTLDMYSDEVSLERPKHLKDE